MDRTQVFCCLILCGLFADKKEHGTTIPEQKAAATVSCWFCDILDGMKVILPVALVVKKRSLLLSVFWNERIFNAADFAVTNTRTSYFELVVSSN